MSQEIMEQDVALEEQEAYRKEAYKLIGIYIQSENYKGIIEYAERKKAEILADIKKEYHGRKKIEATESELSNVREYAEFMKDIWEKIDDSEGGKILKKDFLEQYDAAYTHIYLKESKPESGIYADMPMFTKLDTMKTKYRMYNTIQAKFAELHNVYGTEKEEQIDLHPYEN